MLLLLLLLLLLFLFFFLPLLLSHLSLSGVSFSLPLESQVLCLLGLRARRPAVRHAEAVKTKLCAAAEAAVVVARHVITSCRSLQHSLALGALNVLFTIVRQGCQLLIRGLVAATIAVMLRSAANTQAVAALPTLIVSVRRVHDGSAAHFHTVGSVAAG